MALLALVLACLGVFGVVAYGARLRKKEIGVRVALGASRSDIFGGLVRQLAWPLVIALLLGPIAASQAVKLMKGEPFFIPPFAVLLAFEVGALLVATVALAALIPAARALRIDPALTLRGE